MGRSDSGRAHAGIARHGREWHGAAYGHGVEPKENVPRGQRPVPEEGDDRLVRYRSPGHLSACLRARFSGCGAGEEGDDRLVTIPLLADTYPLLTRAVQWVWCGLRKVMIA